MLASPDVAAAMMVTLGGRHKVVHEHARSIRTAIAIMDNACIHLRGAACVHSALVSMGGVGRASKCALGEVASVLKLLMGVLEHA